MSHSCGWTTGVHMTEFSTDGARLYEAGALRVSRSSSAAKGTYVFWTLGVDVLSRLTLETPHHGWGGRFWAGDDDWVGIGSGLHNHLQSSGEHNTSSAHSRSTSSVNPSPASLSWCSVATILFPCGKGSGSGTSGEGVGLSGHLGRRVDGAIGGGQ